MYKATYEYCAVSQASCQFLLFGSRYLFQYPVLKHHKPMESPEYDRPSFTHTYEAGKIEVPYILSFVCSRERKNKETLNG